MTSEAITAAEAALPPPPPLGFVVVVFVLGAGVVFGSKQWPFSQSQLLLHSSSSSQMQMST